jgi:hypothetical protein
MTQPRKPPPRPKPNVTGMDYEPTWADRLIEAMLILAVLGIIGFLFYLIFLAL